MSNEQGINMKINALTLAQMEIIMHDEAETNISSLSLSGPSPMPMLAHVLLA